MLQLALSATGPPALVVGAVVTTIVQLGPTGVPVAQVSVRLDALPVVTKLLQFGSLIVMLAGNKFEVVRTEIGQSLNTRR